MKKEKTIEIIKARKENDRGDTASVNENGYVESFYDYIFGLIDNPDTERGRELLEAVRLFGKLRYNQAIDDVLAIIIKEKSPKTKSNLNES